jgi:methyltransferase (TIGR00027 family)
MADEVPDSSAVRVALWCARPDMDPVFTAGFRSSIVARTRFIEDLVAERVDQPDTSHWKRQRLAELGYGIPDWLQLVPVDFEAGGSWRHEIAGAGFALARPALVTSAGVSMYLTREANQATLRDLAALAPGSTVAITFFLPLDQVDEQDRDGWTMSVGAAARSGTPFLSFFAADEFLALARAAGFADVRHVSGTELNQRYFSNRADGLRMSTGEDFLVATV